MASTGSANANYQMVNMCNVVQYLIDRTMSNEEAGKSISRIERFEDLEAWQQARKLVNTVYNLSDVGAFARDFYAA
ncbi:MAG: hypothetical protein C0183_21870 [Roseiflexus castenholzii]|nr:MAG: hypothetical protein C0183_21870 [Roseiflexus castenholzii]